MKYLSHDSRSPGRDLNLEPPEYEAGVLTTRLRRSIPSGKEPAICAVALWHRIQVFHV
jgi:hypothetical protein